MTTSTDPHHSARQRTRHLIVGVAIVIPATISLAGAIVMTRWIPDLPDPVAIHWTANGPDGTAAAGLVIALPSVVTALFSALATVTSWRTGPNGGLLRAQKVLVSTSVFLAAILTLAVGGSLAIQRGLATAEQAGGVGTILVIAFVSAGILALLSWFILPPSERSTPKRTVAEPIAATPTERLYFATSARLGIPIALVILVIVGALAVTLTVQAIKDPRQLLIPATVGILVLLLAMSTLSWRVVIDRHGIRVRSALGWPRISIAADQIASVAVITVDPLSEFGGYGWRWDSEGRSGVVLSRGEAIEVTRTNGKRFVVTAHDASRGAAVLAAVQKNRQ